MTRQRLAFYSLVVLAGLSALPLSGAQAGILFCLIGCALAVVTHSKDFLISPALLILVPYLLAYPLPTLIPDLYPDVWKQIPADAIDYGILWASRGFGGFAVGYALVEKLGGPGRYYVPPDEATAQIGQSYTVFVFTCIGWLALLAWLATVLLFGVSLTFIETATVRDDSAAGTFLQIITLLSGLRYSFFLGYLVLRFFKLTDKHLYVLLLALVAVSLVEIVAVGSKGSIIRLVAMFPLLLGCVPLRLRLRQAVITGLAVVAVYGSFAVVTEYREIMREELDAGRDVTTFAVQADSFRSALFRSLPFSNTAADRITITKQERVLNRFGAGMFSFANLLRHTGRQSPYEYAVESFLVPIYSVAPRALISDKPEFFHSGRNAREYYNWSYGGISVTLLGSLYYCWGYPGIVFGMPFFGALLAVFARRVRLRRAFSPHWIVLFVTLIVPMMDVGQNMHGSTINLVRVSCLLWLMFLSFPLVRNAMRRRIQRMLRAL